ncbi:hypothetical protein CKO45_17615, partial [Paracraurococcus ruber]|nr:hypothetical protein [Paracraurococcus ruber]
AGGLLTLGLAYWLFIPAMLAISGLFLDPVAAADGFGARVILGVSLEAGRNGGTPISESRAAGLAAGAGSAAGMAGASSRLRPKMAILPPFSRRFGGQCVGRSHAACRAMPSG